jgi:hypothetical protein
LHDDYLHGYQRNDSSGTSAADTFNLQQGGDGHGHRPAANDLFNMGAALNAADKIDGGRGSDIVDLDGDYWRDSLSTP